MGEVESALERSNAGDKHQVHTCRAGVNVVFQGRLHDN